MRKILGLYIKLNDNDLIKLYENIETSALYSEKVRGVFEINLS